MEVVITRDADDGAPFARALGPTVTAVFLPVTAVVPASPEDAAGLAARVADLGRYAHIFVASRHAVPPLAAALSAQAIDPASAPPVTAVGPATAAALTAAGFRARARGDTGDEAAAALAAEGVAGACILMPRASGGRDEPLVRLRAAGAEVDEVIAYQMRTAAADAPELAAGLAALTGAGAAAAACLLFAPSQVAALAELLAGHGGLAALAGRGIALVAIGPTTAAALAAHGAAAAAVAASPTPAAMANALTSVYPDVSP